MTIQSQINWAYVFPLFLARPGPGGPGGSGPGSGSGPGQGPPGLPGLPYPGLAVPAAVSSKSSAPNLTIWSGTETGETLGTPPVPKVPVSLFLLLSAPNRLDPV